MCGQCVAACPVKAIELSVFQKRVIKTSMELDKNHSNKYDTFYGIKQKTNVENTCIGCAMCTLVCPK